LPEHQLTEIFITGQKERTALASPLQNHVIPDPRIELGNIDHLVAVSAETFHDLAIDAFIGDELHAALSGMG
jgi:hypothetical protein